MSHLPTYLVSRRYGVVTLKRDLPLPLSNSCVDNNVKPYVTSPLAYDWEIPE